MNLLSIKEGNKKKQLKESCQNETSIFCVIYVVEKFN